MNHSITLLHRHHLRVTEPRTDIFETTKHASEALSFTDIAAQCPTINRSTIYRTLDTCIAIGVVRVIAAGWKKRYELTDLFRPHHHHLLCTVCEKLTTIQEEELERFITFVAKNHGFHPTSHQFEIEGYCKKCHARQNTTAS